MAKHKVYFALSVGVLSLGMAILAGIVLHAYFMVKRIDGLPVYSSIQQVQEHQRLTPGAPMVLEGVLETSGEVPQLHSQNMIYLQTEEYEMQGGRWKKMRTQLSMAERITLLGIEVGDAIPQLPSKQGRYQPRLNKTQLSYKYIAGDSAISLYMRPNRSLKGQAIIAYGSAGHLRVEVVRRAVWQVLPVLIASVFLYLPLRAKYLATRGSWRWYIKQPVLKEVL